jgi:hypothetical protein
MDCASGVTTISAHSSNVNVVCGRARGGECMLLGYTTRLFDHIHRQYFRG